MVSMGMVLFRLKKNKKTKKTIPDCRNELTLQKIRYCTLQSTTKLLILTERLHKLLYSTLFILYFLHFKEGNSYSSVSIISLTCTNPNMKCKLLQAA